MDLSPHYTVLHVYVRACHGGGLPPKMTKLYSGARTNDNGCPHSVRVSLLIEINLKKQCAMFISFKKRAKQDIKSVYDVIFFGST
jgi:hypothetical protein